MGVRGGGHIFLTAHESVHRVLGPNTSEVTEVVVERMEKSSLNELSEISLLLFFHTTHTPGPISVEKVFVILTF